MSGFIQTLADDMSRLCAKTNEEGMAPAAPEPAAGTTAPAGGTAPQIVEYSKRGFHLDATVPPENVVAAAELLGARGFALDCITGVDWIAQGQMEVVYDYFHPEAPWRVAVRARVPRDNPSIPTISAVFPGANWHERETHDFFDINFIGHPDLSPFLLPEDADFHPLRKDFAPLP